MSSFIKLDDSPMFLKQVNTLSDFIVSYKTFIFQFYKSDFSGLTCEILNLSFIFLTLFLVRLSIPSSSNDLLAVVIVTNGVEKVLDLHCA